MVIHYHIRIASVRHSPLQKLSADVRFPDLGTEGKNEKRMSGSVLGLIPSSGSEVYMQITDYGREAWTRLRIT